MIEMIAGAREGKLSGFRRLLATAMARDLDAFVVPGPEIARACGLDIEAAGLHTVASPRHASVLLVVGALPPALREAAAVVYAQMMRPRALFILGTDTLPPLPAADVSAALHQKGLVDGVRHLRRAFAAGAFRAGVEDFDAPALRVRIEYTCPMHPEVIQDEPGSCPLCGMTLIPRETQAGTGHRQPAGKETHGATDREAPSDHGHDSHPEMEHQVPGEYTCPMHPEVVRAEPGSCPVCGMNLVPRDVAHEAAPEHEHRHMDHEPAAEYTCPMHPEVLQNEPGSCPICGMDLVRREPQQASGHEAAGKDPGSDHAGMNHGAMDHEAMSFMSMVDVTRDLPRSSDGLPMDWIDAPFGPFFPGLAGGLQLTLTLDGDTVAGAGARSLASNTDLLRHLPMDAPWFIERLTGMDPLAPVAYRLLACRALEQAAGADVPADVAFSRAGALERERLMSHLNWLALFGEQSGFAWLARRAAALQLACRHAGPQQLLSRKPDIESLIKRLHGTPLLKARTAGIGRLEADTALRGPVARASGMNEDARASDRTFSMLGFATSCRDEGDAFARLQLRLAEMIGSLALIEAAGAVGFPAPCPVGDLSATGEATVETPRGPARLRVTLEGGRVVAAQLETPSTAHLTLVDRLTAQQELGDALVAVGSLDLSPWEIRP